MFVTLRVDDRFDYLSHSMMCFINIVSTPLTLQINICNLSTSTLCDITIHRFNADVIDLINMLLIHCHIIWGNKKNNKIYIADMSNLSIKAPNNITRGSWISEK